MDSTDKLMHLALEQAHLAAQAGEVPVGAVIADGNGNVIAAAHNRVEQGTDATAHAELLALQQAQRVLGRAHLSDCTLAVTLEPCAMCAQAMAWAKVGRVVFGAFDVKSGAVVNGARVFAHSHHKPEVQGGIQETACSQLMSDFFKNLRKK